MEAEKSAVPRPLGVGEAARVCRVTTRTINNWIRAGKLKAYATPGGHFRNLAERSKEISESSQYGHQFRFQGRASEEDSRGGR